MSAYEGKLEVADRYRDGRPLTQSGFSRCSLVSFNVSDDALILNVCDQFICPG
jgi:hypothetical protein